MKKLLTVVFTLLLAGSLALARPGDDKARATADAKKAPKGGNHAVQKIREDAKGHKGGKKGKKGTSTTNPTPSPK